MLFRVSLRFPSSLVPRKNISHQCRYKTFFTIFLRPQKIRLGIDSLPASVRDDIDSWLIMPIGLALIVLQASVRVDINSWQDRAHWFGIDSLQTSVRVDSDIMPIGLQLIVHSISCPSFDIDSKVKLSYTWINTDLRTHYGVGHFLQCK